MTTFRLVPHSIDPDRVVLEVWDDDQFIGEITPVNADDPSNEYPGLPGARVISKYVKYTAGRGLVLHVGIGAREMP